MRFVFIFFNTKTCKNFVIFGQTVILLFIQNLFRQLYKQIYFNKGMSLLWTSKYFKILNCEVHILKILNSKHELL